MFYNSGTSLYIVTARHVLEDIDPTLIGVPAAPVGVNRSIWTLGKATICMPSEDSFDVAVVRLEDDEFLARVSRNWEFLRPSNISTELAQDYVVAGYPNSTVRITNGNLSPVDLLTQVYTQHYSGPVQGERGPYDLFLRFDRTAERPDGSAQATPRLEGVSGSAIWSISRSGNIWSPESMLRIAAVQVSYLHSAYIRAKSWDVVHALIQKVESGIDA
jgi:hypothetical protein